MHFDPPTSFPGQEERGPWERVFDPRCSHRRSPTSAGISFQYSGSITDQEHLTRTFEQNTSNVVSCVPRSFCGLLKKELCKLILINLFGCFSGKLKLQKVMESYPPNLLAVAGVTEMLADLFSPF